MSVRARAIFRQCYEKFCELRKAAFGPDDWSRRDEEYMADFVGIAKRALTKDEHRVFRIHFLLGASANLCILRLAIDCGAFFHTVAQIEQRVGRAFREQPQALFPIDEYFRPPNANVNRR